VVTYQFKPSSSDLHVFIEENACVLEMTVLFGCCMRYQDKQVQLHYSDSLKL